jgi:hypothetical protein
MMLGTDISDQGSAIRKPEALLDKLAVSIADLGHKRSATKTAARNLQAGCETHDAFATKRCQIGS